MDWPTIRELIAYVFGNALGMAATVAFGLNVWELVTGPVDTAAIPFGVIGLLGSGAVAYWWLAWAIREYIGPAAERTRAASDPDGLDTDSRP